MSSNVYYMKQYLIYFLLELEFKDNLGLVLPKSVII